MIRFSSGSYRCAGEHLAIAETDVFIRKLLAIKGLHIEKLPNIVYNKTVEGYEINDLLIRVD